MHYDERPTDLRHDTEPSSEGYPDAQAVPPTGIEETDEDYLDESLGDEISALIDDGKTWAEAEIGYQKTRAALAAKRAGTAAGLFAGAAITLHIALLALAVGLVLALAPLITIWGAIAVVVGLLLILTGWLALKARRNLNQLSDLFSDSHEGASR